MIGYTTQGTGPNGVIVLHDWMSTHEGFAAVRSYLDGERFTYVFADHRGYGRSRDLGGPFTVERAANDVLELADALGWERFHLVAHSMSGMVGQRLSIDAPARLQTVVLVTPVTAAGMPLDNDGQRLFEGAVVDDDAWIEVAKAVTGGRLGPAFYASKLAAHRAAVDPEAFAGFLNMWCNTDFSAEMRDLATPALVIAGQHDFPAFSPQVYESSIGGWYTDATIELVANAGHYPMSETPPYFAKLVEDFIEARTP